MCFYRTISHSHQIISHICKLYIDIDINYITVRINSHFYFGTSLCVCLIGKLVFGIREARLDLFPKTTKTERPNIDFKKTQKTKLLLASFKNSLWWVHDFDPCSGHHISFPLTLGGRGRKMTPLIYPLIFENFFGHEMGRYGSY